jgi:hypothetical protein
MGTMMKDVRWTEYAQSRLRETNSPYADFFQPGLELQIEPITGDDDALDRWAGEWPIRANPHSLRIPADGNAEEGGPRDNDGPVDFHPELISHWGTTWWNWRDGQTEAVFLEYDHGHGPHALDDAGIAQTDQWASRLPYVVVCTSKGGKGRHWLGLLEKPLPAKTRKEHIRNCRWVRDRVLADLGVTELPTCAAPGSMQHIWHHAPKAGGFRLLKPATSRLAIDPPPPETEAEKKASAKAKQDGPADWDKTHKGVFATMEAAGWPVIHKKRDGQPMVQLHSAGLLHDFRTNRRAGRYSTLSQGHDKSKPNAYAFPRENGGLAVYRFQVEEETDDWRVTDKGDLLCLYNVPVSFREAVKTCGGFDRRGNAIVKDADEAFRLLGVNLAIPEALKGREVTLRRGGSTLFVSIPGTKEENAPGWKYHRKNWEYDLPNALPEMPVNMYEDRLRYTSDKHKGKSWTMKDDRGGWLDVSESGAKTWLTGFGLGKYDVAEVMQFHLERNHQLVQIPFAEEDQPGRVWNRFGAKRVQEAPGEFPAIRAILEHVGKNLTPVVRQDAWCQEHRIATGAEYLALWAAVMFRHPERRLPGLFMWSEIQSIGKSTYGRMLSRGFQDAHGWTELRKELTRDDFNDRMRGAALCLLEEVDLSANFAAYQLVKNYIDNPSITIRGIYVKAETERNYTHFIHTANYRNFCPIYPGDTRIVMWRVDPYEGPDLDWTGTLCAIVDGQMPAFLHHLLKLELPPSSGRLYLPILDTEDRREAMAERKAEIQGWYGQLREFALEGWIEAKTAAEILGMLVGAVNDPRLPKSAAGLALQLKQLNGKLTADGLTMTCTDGDKKHPAKYTIKPTVNASPPTNNNGKK